MNLSSVAKGVSHGLTAATTLTVAAAYARGHRFYSVVLPNLANRQANIPLFAFAAAAFVIDYTVKNYFHKPENKSFASPGMTSYAPVRAAILASSLIFKGLLLATVARLFHTNMQPIAGLSALVGLLSNLRTRTPVPSQPLPPAPTVTTKPPAETPQETKKAEDEATHSYLVSSFQGVALAPMEIATWKTQITELNFRHTADLFKAKALVEELKIKENYLNCALTLAVDKAYQDQIPTINKVKLEVTALQFQLQRKIEESKTDIEGLLRKLAKQFKQDAKPPLEFRKKIYQKWPQALRLLAFFKENPVFAQLAGSLHDEVVKNINAFLTKHLNTHLPEGMTTFKPLDLTSRDDGGLYNIRNSCWMNAVLQALQAGGLLPALLEKSLVKSLKESPEEFADREQFVLALKETFELAKAKPNRHEECLSSLYTLRNLIAAINRKNNYIHTTNRAEFAGATERQIDASAFLDFALCMLDYKSIQVQTKTHGKGPDNKDSSRTDTEDMRVLPLSMSIQPNMNQPLSVQALLDIHYAPSQMEDATIGGVACSNCGQRQTLTGQPPEFLAFTFNRFNRADAEKITDVIAWKEGELRNNKNLMALIVEQVGPEAEDPVSFAAALRMMAMGDLGIENPDGDTIKIPNPLHFPEDGILDLRNAFDQASAVPYEVVSVISHKGNTIQQGHYDACRRDASGWYHFDDDKVKAEKDLSKAYVMVLKRVDHRAADSDQKDDS